MVTLDPPPDLVEIAEDLDAMRTAEAVSLLFIPFCRDPQFRRSSYKPDPVSFRRSTNRGGVAMNVDNMTDDEFIDGQDQLAYKHQSNRADILRTLKLKAEVNQ